MAAYRRVYDSRHLQADCKKTRISSGTIRSAIEYGLLLHFYYYHYFAPPRRRGALSDTAIHHVRTADPSADGRRSAATVKLPSVGLYRLAAPGAITHTHLTALCPGLPRVSRYQKDKTNLDVTEARPVSGSGISASLQTDNHTSTPPVSFYRPDALPAGAITCLRLKFQQFR